MVDGYMVDEQFVTNVYKNLQTMEWRVETWEERWLLYSVL